MKIRVVVADDEEMFRQGVASLINGERDMRVVAQAGDGRGAVQAAVMHSPDVAILGVRMPILSGLEAFKQMSRDAPDVKVILLSMCSAWPMPLWASRMGVCGHVLRDCSFNELATAIRIVSSGRRCFCRGVQEGAAKWCQMESCGPGRNGLEKLTEREFKVFTTLSLDKTLKETADQLGRSIDTIKTHLRNIRAKTGLHGKREIIRLARECGFGSSFDLRTA